MPNYLPLSLRMMTTEPILQASPLIDATRPSALNSGVDARVVLVAAPGGDLLLFVKFSRSYAGDKALYFTANLGDVDEIDNPLASFGPPERAVAACEEQFPEPIRGL